MAREDFSQAMNGERVFRRLEGFDLTSYNYQTVLVDPPRAGLDPGSVELISRFERIIYISCNPETLRSNLEVLVKTHKIEKNTGLKKLMQTLKSIFLLGVILHSHFFSLTKSLPNKYSGKA